MFYRVQASLAFVSEDEARDFYHDCDLARLKSVVINPSLANEERGGILLQHCLHDIHPLTPCPVIAEDFTPYPPPP